MKAKKLETLKNKKLQDLVKSADDLRKEIVSLYAKKAAMELTNLKEIKFKRHELATILNIINTKKEEEK